jgi:hypothetical protein
VLARVLDQPRLRATLGAGALDHADQFGWTSTAEAMLAVYREALTGSTSAGSVAS